MIISERENKTVYKDGDKIIKTGPESIINDEYYWYNAVSNTSILTPKVYEKSKRKIVLEYIEEDAELDMFSVMALKKYIVEMSNIKAPQKNFNEFAEYRNPELLSQKDEYEQHYSLMHGNLTPRNILFTTRGPYLIDPLIRYNYNGPPMFNSYLIDYGSLFYSLNEYKLIIKDDYHGLVEEIYEKTNLFRAN